MKRLIDAADEKSTCRTTQQPRGRGQHNRVMFPTGLRRNGSGCFFDWRLCLLMMLAVNAGVMACDAPARNVIVDSDLLTVEECRDCWNRAVRAAREERWSELQSMVAPNERSLWNRAEESDSKGRMAEQLIARLILPFEIGSANAKVLCYREANGQSLSRIYAERKRRSRGARGGHGTRPFCLGTISGEADGSQSLHLLKTSGFEFGLGASVGGIRLDVRVKNEVISSWDDFALDLTLVNTTDSDSVPMQLSPSLALFQNVSLGIRGADSADHRARFESWKTEADRFIASGMPDQSLFRSCARSHQVGILKPGESQRHSLRMPAVGLVPGPSGRFQLFVEYDPNLEPYPFEAALPCWRHRIASRAFSVTVGSSHSNLEEE